MDGIFLAYHNTARLFGFQYVPLEDMEDRIYGSKSRGDRVFHKCVGLLERVVEEVVACFPDKVCEMRVVHDCPTYEPRYVLQSVSVLAETPEGRGTMHLYIQPLESVDGDGTKPIMQLNVTAASFLGEDRVSGNRAVDGDGQPCECYGLRLLDVPNLVVRDPTLVNFAIIFATKAVTSEFKRCA